VDDIRDPETAERLEHEDSGEYLRRREFLQRTAMTAGLATGMGLLLDSETLVAEAASRQRRVKIPAPKNMPIDTFVVLMMENRSFDHYLGWMPGVDGRQAGLNYRDKVGALHQTHRLTPDFQGCAFNDPDHSWEGGRVQLDGGKMDGFRRSGNNDDFSLGYYTEPDLPFIGHAAKAFTTYDRFFCSILASTFPNREYMHAGESYGNVSNTIPTSSAGFPDNTIFAALAKQGISNRYFYNDIPVSALWGPPGVARSARVEEYYTRCQAGTLPHVSFVDPSFLNEGGGTSGDEHPHGDIRVGQAYMSDVVHAFMESPQFKRGAIIICYDEWGGFFDHVRPPRVPDQRNSPDLNKDYGQMGFRIPAIAISPYVKRGHVDHSIYGFESILKMICHRFAIPPLNKRVRYAHNIAQSFDWESEPQTTPPTLPDPPTVAGSTQCANRGVSLLSTPSGAPLRPAPHDLETLVSSGYLDRLGFHYKPATASSTFREPHKVESAHRAAGGG
jgi:phospholipase C